MTSNKSNLSTYSDSLQSSTANRKRKIDTSDFEDKFQNKIFLTEAMLIKSLKNLSLDLSESKSSTNSEDPQDDDEKNDNQNDTDNLFQKSSQVELHKLLKDNLRKDDLQDSFMNKIWDIERRKISMQLVPYMPIHPAQLNSSSNINNQTDQNSTQTDEKGKETQMKTSPPTTADEAKTENDDHLFKRPLIPPITYTVEEPPDNTIRRTSKMKRSYSQSVRYNSNITVTELKDDTTNYLFYPAQTEYFVTEPLTPVSTVSPSSFTPNSAYWPRPTVQISEYFDFPSTFSSQKDFSKPFEPNDIDMEFNVLSDIHDKMDDDV